MRIMRSPHASAKRARRRLMLDLGGFAAIGLAASCASLTGCQPLRPTPMYPPPPGMPISTAGTLGATAGTTVAARPADTPGGTIATATNSGTIVRGQQGGFAMPPLGAEPADGGRHSREPLQVSGQPAAQVAQVPQTSPMPGQLPPPSTSPAPPAPSTYPPSSYPPTGSYGATPPPAMGAAPGYGGGLGIGGGTYESLPEIGGDALGLGPGLAPAAPYVPVTRTADIIVNGYPARTGRIQFGAAVNSDAGVTGQITIEERNFDIKRFPSSFQDLFSGTAFRGAGQTFRAELMPGDQYQRYSVSFSDPNLLGYLPISFSTSAFLFDRRYEDWDEQRGGGRVSLGYLITPDLSLSFGLRGENVEVSNPDILGVPQLDEVLGDNSLFSGQVSLTHDTRNNPFTPSEGHYFQASFEQAFGDFDFPRTELSYAKYFLVRERADGSGRQTLTTAWNVGFSGEDTPLFENYFAGGYTTLRGFRFRGASPTVAGVQVGGRFQFLGSVEYMFPLTADDMLRAVAFLDYGTVEQDIEIDGDNFRVAPGVGLRIAVPALGPAPLAFDFAFPVAYADTDDRQTFSFYMGTSRKF